MQFNPESNGIDAPSVHTPLNSAIAHSGKLLPPEQHLLLFTADDWENFIREWAQFQKTKYKLVDRLGGADDYGIDVAGFVTDKGFQGEWDNYQCKYYTGNPLAPGTAIPEIGKLIWHAFCKKITLPRSYYFFSPKDCGPSLKKLLLDSEKLKQKVFEKWDEWCSNSITSTQKIDLTGDFADFVDKIDFSIFQYKPRHDVIEEHRKTPYYVIRFGGGLPKRHAPDAPPEMPFASESRYISQLYEAYSDKEKSAVEAGNINEFPKLHAHYQRQREAFFHAESLKSFARDSVPEGTFESLQSEIHSGVIDTCEDDHEHGFARMRAVIERANSIQLTENGLIQVTKIQDRHGMCHQLANEDQLTWVSSND
ncbi:MAG TPA: ABC-three component system protein [Sphingopyxis sp.]|uniref:ABC-three component system protein n=1 Tax=Sphingopyxis sp. TaxID=1908224 RepID=UPI002C38CE6D|nr:ABC-three component system protein [Sphingopyxis sp.]HWW59132.1 ABC-three component system protein [Sphingopyxis sp.]